MIKQKGRFQINHLPFHLLALEKEGQNKFKANKRKMKIRIIAQIHETEYRKIQEMKI